MDRKEKLLPLPSDFFKKVPVKKAPVKTDVKGEEGKVSETPAEPKVEPKKQTPTTNRGKPNLLQNFLDRKKDQPQKPQPVVTKNTDAEREARKVLGKPIDPQAERERVSAEEKAAAKKRKELEDKMWNSDAKKLKAEEEEDGDEGKAAKPPAPDAAKEPAAKKQKRNQKDKKDKKAKKEKHAKKEKKSKKEQRKSTSAKPAQVDRN